MANFDIDKLLAANPKAAKHKDVIRETLSALGRIKEAGLPDSGYNLSPTQGQKTAGGTGRSVPAKNLKMTYCA